MDVGKKATKKGFSVPSASKSSAVDSCKSVSNSTVKSKKKQMPQNNKRLCEKLEKEKPPETLSKSKTKEICPNDQTLPNKKKEKPEKGRSKPPAEKKMMRSLTETEYEDIFRAVITTDSPENLDDEEKENAFTAATHIDSEGQGKNETATNCSDTETTNNVSVCKTNSVTEKTAKEVCPNVQILPSKKKEKPEKSRSRPLPEKNKMRSLNETEYEDIFRGVITYLPENSDDKEKENVFTAVTQIDSEGQGENETAANCSDAESASNASVCKTNSDGGEKNHRKPKKKKKGCDRKFESKCKEKVAIDTEEIKIEDEEVQDSELDTSSKGDIENKISSKATKQKKKNGCGNKNVEGADKKQKPFSTGAGSTDEEDFEQTSKDEPPKKKGKQLKDKDEKNRSDIQKPRDCSKEVPADDGDSSGMPEEESKEETTRPEEEDEVGSVHSQQSVSSSLLEMAVDLDQWDRPEDMQQANEHTPRASEAEDDPGDAPLPKGQKAKKAAHKKNELAPRKLHFGAQAAKVSTNDDETSLQQNDKSTTKDIPSKVKQKKKKKHLKQASEGGSGRGNKTLKLEKKELECEEVPAECGTWVQCCEESCKKWRYLSDIHDPAEVPDHWVCTMNWDAQYNSCDKAEQEYDESDHIFTQFTLGSIVWVKVDGFPWWPAIVDTDPDYDIFCEIPHEDSMLPTDYHVVFLDDKVTRTWIRKARIRQLLHPHLAVGSAYLKGHKFKKDVGAAMKKAEEALDMSLQERLDAFGFRKCFKNLHTKWTKPVPKKKGQKHQRPKKKTDFITNEKERCRISSCDEDSDSDLNGYSPDHSSQSSDEDSDGGSRTKQRSNGKKKILAPPSARNKKLKKIHDDSVSEKPVTAEGTRKRKPKKVEKETVKPKKKKFRSPSPTGQDNSAQMDHEKSQLKAEMVKSKKHAFSLPKKVENKIGPENKRQEEDTGNMKKMSSGRQKEIQKKRISCDQADEDAPKKKKKFQSQMAKDRDLAQNLKGGQEKCVESSDESDTETKTAGQELEKKSEDKKKGNLKLKKSFDKDGKEKSKVTRNKSYATHAEKQAKSKSQKFLAPSKHVSEKSTPKPESSKDMSSDTCKINMESDEKAADQEKETEMEKEIAPSFEKRVEHHKSKLSLPKKKSVVSCEDKLCDGDSDNNSPMLSPQARDQFVPSIDSCHGDDDDEMLETELMGDQKESSGKEVFEESFHKTGARDSDSDCLDIDVEEGSIPILSLEQQVLDIESKCFSDAGSERFSDPLEMAED